MTSVSNWVPVEYDPTVISRVLKASAIEAMARPVSMGSLTEEVPRSGGNDVNVGDTYVNDDSDHDKILLKAFKFTGQNKLEEDQLADANSWVPVVQQLANDWYISYATLFDNACLAVTAAKNGTTVPFTSVYKKITSNGDADSAEAGYTANDNLNQSGSGGVTYDDLSSTLALVEGSEYWDEGQAFVIAHPAFRDVFRTIKDDHGDPIFVGGQGPDSGTPDRLFGVEVHWSRGAKTSGVPSKSPSGNPLLFFVGDRGLLIRGDRTPVESRLNEADAHDATDEVAVKFRTRKAFGVGNVLGISCLEKTA